MRNIVSNVLVGTLLLTLAGCASSMVPQTTRHDDQGITSAADKAMRADAKIQGSDVDVQTREGVIYLTGVVPTEDIRREAGRIAWRTKGVEGVVNNVSVGERTVGSWLDDVMISSKVKSKLIANSNIKAGDIDVGSSQGVVSLIGRVGTQAIKDDAERTARATSGVKDVNNELVVGRIRS